MPSAWSVQFRADRAVWVSPAATVTFTGAPIRQPASRPRAARVQMSGWGWVGVRGGDVGNPTLGQPSSEGRRQCPDHMGKGRAGPNLSGETDTTEQKWELQDTLLTHLSNYNTVQTHFSVWNHTNDTHNTFFPTMSLLFFTPIPDKVVTVTSATCKGG